MTEIVFKTAGAIIVLNIILLLSPDGKYEKYVSFITGLIIMAVLIGNFKNITYPVTKSFAGFEESVFENSALQEEIFRQTEKSLEQSFMEYADKNFKNVVDSISVTFNGEIQKIEINLKDSAYIENVANSASEFFDIEKSKLIITKF